MITKHCAKCGTDTLHYEYTNRCKCQPCAIAANANRPPQIGSSKGRTKPNAAKAADVAPPRTYNLMKAPEYTGENWQNVRGQMQPTVRYVGVTG